MSYPLLNEDYSGPICVKFYKQQRYKKCICSVSAQKPALCNSIYVHINKETHMYFSKIW